jgi:hypothetical protein
VETGFPKRSFFTGESGRSTNLKHWAPGLQAGNGKQIPVGLRDEIADRKRWGGDISHNIE